VERIEQHVLASDPDPGDEVAREAHALHVEAEAPADLDQHQRERDRDAQPPVEDVVEVAVARIEVVAAIASEALLLEEELPEAMQAAQLVLPAAGGGRLRSVVEAGPLLVH